MKLIRSSKCSFKFATHSKLLELKRVLTEYGRVCNIFIEHFWKKGTPSSLLTRSGYSYHKRSRSRPLWASSYRLTDLQRSVLLGDMLGDGSIVSKYPWKTAYYQCAHSIVQKEFVVWKHSIFSPLSCRLKEYWVEDSGIRRDYVRMGTWSTCELFHWFKEFYPLGSGNKIFPESVIKSLDWLGLAVWFMGDGTMDINKKRIRFSVGLQIDLEGACSWLSQRFPGMFSAKRYEKEWHLNVLKPFEFAEKIGPFLLPCFYYKIAHLF